MKDLKLFLSIVAYILGILGGVGYALYNNSIPIAVALCWVAYMAFPYIKNCYNERSIK